jgi:hypothetical protein
MFLTALRPLRSSDLAPVGQAWRDVTRCTQLAELTGHRDSVVSVAISPGWDPFGVAQLRLDGAGVGRDPRDATGRTHRSHGRGGFSDILAGWDSFGVRQQGQDGAGVGRDPQCATGRTHGSPGLGVVGGVFAGWDPLAVRQRRWTAKASVHPRAFVERVWCLAQKARLTASQRHPR